MPPRRVQLRVPAEPSAGTIVRLTTIAFATGLAFDIDELDDLRLAVHELFTAVVAHLEPDDHLVTLEFETDGSTMSVSGTAEPPAPGGPIEVEPLSDAILGAALDQVDLDPGGGLLFRVEKVPTTAA